MVLLLHGIGKKTNLTINVGTSLNILNDIKAAYYKANVVERIIYINVLLFLITVLANLFIIKWFALPTTFSEFIYKPWTIISYAFIHQRLFHILSNLLVLYYIGNLFLNFYSKKQFVNIYFLGGVFGAVLFLLYYYLANTIGGPLVGASAAVTAIFVAIATKIPRYAIQLRFIGSVELWVLAAIWVVMSILQLAGPDKGGAIAHIGGALLGFIYANQLEKGNDIGKWFEAIISYFTNLFKPTKKSPLKTVYKSKSRTSKSTVEKSKQKKIDDILDKISKSGYETLTQEEKDFLFRAGKK